MVSFSDVIPEWESLRTTDTILGIGILCCTNDFALFNFSLADSSLDYKEIQDSLMNLSYSQF